MQLFLPPVPDLLRKPFAGERRTAGLCLASRAVFAAVLLPWLLIGGLSKLGGLSLSVGPTVEGLPLSLGAYYAYVPGKAEDAMAGGFGFGIIIQSYVGLMVLLEFALPILIVLGFQARLAVVLLAGHQMVFLISSQPHDDFGALFDASPFDMLPDQLLLWIALIAPVALFGPGFLSVDSLIARRKKRRGRKLPADPI